MTQIVGEVVLMVRTWAVCHAQAIIKVLNGVASQTGGNDRAVASLTVLVALQTSSCFCV
jgi:hypothetical protein